MDSNVSKKINNTYCCVPQCKSKGSNTPKVSFHKFPAVKSVIRKTALDGRLVLVNRRKEWTRILKIGKEVSNRMCVCSKHFDKDSYTFPPEKCVRPRLKASALPTLFLPITSSYSEEKNTLKKEDSAKRLARYSEINRKKRISNVSNEMPSTSAVTPDTSRISEVQMADAFNDMSGASTQIYTDIVPEETVDDEETDDLVQPSADELNAVNVLLGFRTTTCKQDAVVIENSTPVQHRATQVCSGDLKTQHLIKAEDLNNKTLFSLTGIPSLSLLNYLAEIISEEINFSNRHQLPVKERILLTMMRMYLNISFSSLSIFFGCTVTTASNIFYRIIPILSSILGLFIIWSTKEEVTANLPKVFKNFPNVRIVLDCTEVYVQKPKCLVERIDLYSHYYKDLTVKFMVCVSPGGLINFVSRGYGGKTSDQHIFVESKLVEMLEPHVDEVMVDKGFLIENVCEENFIKIVRPPFLRQKKQFSASEAKLTARIAAARVHVERVIQRIKVFGVFKSTFPYKFIKVLDHMVVIAAGLANLGSPVLGDDKYIFNEKPDEE